MPDGFRSDRLRALLQAVDPEYGRQNRLAARLGVSRKTVCDWMKGRRIPTAPVLVALAAYLGTTAEDLIPPDPSIRPPASGE